MNVLVTGGLGYIGSNTVKELLLAGHDVIIVDNLANSNLDVARRIKEVTNKTVKVYVKDLQDKEAVKQIFKNNQIGAVIHFAGLKAVGVSVKQPLEYYKNNIISTLNLIEIMNDYNCKNLVFSSSATVYGREGMLKEEMGTGRSYSPYAMTKITIEQILTDYQKANPDWSISILRYFNPIGADDSGLLGEDPNDTPNNIMPIINNVALGKQKVLKIFGNNYPTFDGTAARDYVHVVDIAKGHIKALDKIIKSSGTLDIYNLGTGKSTTVMQLVKIFKTVCGVEIPYEFVNRREGDLSECYANVDKAREELGWKAQLPIDVMCKSSFEFAKNIDIIKKQLEKEKKLSKKKREEALVDANIVTGNEEKESDSLVNEIIQDGGNK